MKRNKYANNLVEFAQSFCFNTQKMLREVEDEYIKQYIYVYNYFNDLTDDVKHYLLLTSLPFVISGKPRAKLDDLWPIDCRICDTVVHRKVVPTGNLSPKYIVIGDAASVVGDYLDDGEFERAWVYKQTSHILRQTLAKLGIHYYAWYTNLIKCSTPGNRPTTEAEVKVCSRNLKKEIELLQPEIAIVLGKHVAENVKLKLKTIQVYHPSYFVRQGKTWIDYYKYLKEVIM